MQLMKKLARLKATRTSPAKIRRMLGLTLNKGAGTLPLSLRMAVILRKPMIKPLLLAAKRASLPTMRPR
jgi:hypothetical protein